MSVGSAQLEGSGLTEEFGFVSEATAVRTVLVAGDDLGEVLMTALAHPNIPRAGDALSTFVPFARVERRTPRVIGRDQATGKWYVQVTVEYKRHIEQNAVPDPLTGALNDAQHSVRGGASLTGIETDVDRNGNPIEVEFQGDKQRGTVSVLDVHGHLTRQIVQFTNDPDSIVKSWINYVNVSNWKGDGPLQWLCTRVDYELVNSTSTPRAYMFAFDFERRPTKWIYTGRYKKNGITPQGIKDQKDPAHAPGPYGIIDVFWHPERDFNQLFLT